MMNVDKLDTVTVSVDFFEAAFTLQEQNAELLEALENLLRCSEYKATDYCQDCVPAAKEAIRKASK